MSARSEYLLRALVTAQRERKMALKTRDEGLIKSAEARLARVWKDAIEYAAVLPVSSASAGGASQGEHLESETQQAVLSKENKQ